jgi:hypothetical protein
VVVEGRREALQAGLQLGPGQQHHQGLLQQAQVLVGDCRLLAVGVETGVIEVGSPEKGRLFLR